MKHLKTYKDFSALFGINCLYPSLPYDKKGNVIYSQLEEHVFVYDKERFGYVRSDGDFISL